MITQVRSLAASFLCLLPGSSVFLLCEVRALAAAAKLHTAGKRDTRGPASVLFISGAACLSF